MPVESTVPIVLLERVKSIYVREAIVRVKPCGVGKVLSGPHGGLAGSASSGDVCAGRKKRGW
jgi:hypothetical protein